MCTTTTNIFQGTIKIPQLTTLPEAAKEGRPPQETALYPPYDLPSSI